MESTQVSDNAKYLKHQQDQERSTAHKALGTQAFDLVEYSSTLVLNIKKVHVSSGTQVFSLVEYPNVSITVVTGNSSFKSIRVLGLIEYLNTALADVLKEVLLEGTHIFDLAMNLKYPLYYYTTVSLPWCSSIRLG